MYKNLLTALAVFSLVALHACSGGGSRSKTDVAAEIKTPELLSAVPSDALAVVCYSKCDEGLKLYDSTSVLHQLDLSDFRDSRMVLSLSYNGTLSPILVLDAGKVPADSSAAVANLVEQADTLGLQTAIATAEQTGSRNGAVIITPSEAGISTVRRHLEEHTSILDAQDFADALSAAGSASNFVILRTSGASRLMPADILDGVFDRRELTAFVKTLTEWITLVPQGNGFNVFPVNGSEDDTYYTKSIDAVPAGDSKAGEILPASTSLAMAITIDGDGFREGYGKYLDATVKLESYNNRLAALRKASGKDPLKWEKEIGVREVALAIWDGRKVLLVRPEKAAKDKDSEENIYKGFIPALYGAAFNVVDDSFCAASDGWYIYGTKEDISEFMLCEDRMDEGKWQGKSCHAIIYEPEISLRWTKKGIRLWSSNL